MYKVFLTVRNRLSITKKCIHALYKHSDSKFQLYVYNNSTNYLIDEHFEYFRDLYKKNLVSQITFNTDESTFHAFSKAASCNFFGMHHEQDPKKSAYDFLLFLDNDIIVTKGFDSILSRAWKDIKHHKMNNIHVVAQCPGGIKEAKVSPFKIAKINSFIGKLGGSGFWSVSNTFFRDIGYLDLNLMVGLNKKHDIYYWQKMDKKNNGKEYILGLSEKLCVHTGKVAGSICNTLTKNKHNKNKNELIKFKDQESFIDKMTFEEFYNYIRNDKEMEKNW